MSEQFIDLAAEPRALQQMLLEHGVVEAAESPTIENLTGGVSSSILKVTTRRGIYCVKQALPKLKVAKDWFAPATRGFAEIAWLEVAGRIVPRQVPKLFARDKGRDAFVNASVRAGARRCEPEKYSAESPRTPAAPNHISSLAARFGLSK